VTIEIACWGVSLFIVFMLGIRLGGWATMRRAEEIAHEVIEAHARYVKSSQHKGDTK
jgi:hypothetical protein